MRTGKRIGGFLRSMADRLDPPKEAPAPRTKGKQEGNPGPTAEAPSSPLERLLDKYLGKGSFVGIAVVLLVVVAALTFWILDNRGRWVVRSFDVAQVQDPTFPGDRAAIYLLAELGQLGAGSPPPSFSRIQLAPPSTMGTSVQDRPSLTFAGCGAIMPGPGADSTVLLNVPLQLVRAGTGEDSPSPDFGAVSFGGVNISSGLVAQTLLRMLPLDYREFGGRVTESGGELQVTVDLQMSPGTCRPGSEAGRQVGTARDDSSSAECTAVWTVRGPREAFPEMMEYLALRMALDLNPHYLEYLNYGGSLLLSDSELAFGLGLEQLRLRNYSRARGFFQIAEAFSPLRADVDAMLGLATYNTKVIGGDAETAFLEESLRLFEDAVSEDPAGEASLFRPYLACAYHAQGQTAQGERGLAIFNGYLGARASRELEVRMEGLRALPLRGPNRLLAGLGDFLAFVDTGGAVVGGRQNPTRRGLVAPGNGPPREIQVAREGALLVVTADGTVVSVDYSSPDETSSRVLVDGAAVQGVQQLGTS